MKRALLATQSCAYDIIISTNRNWEGQLRAHTHKHIPANRHKMCVTMTRRGAVRAAAALTLALTASAQPLPLPTPPPGTPPEQILNISYLAGAGVTCNDGSTPAVYFRPCSANWDRKSPSEDYCVNITQRWIFVFQADAGYCYDARSCATRPRAATGSGGLPQSVFIDGILLPFAEANPNLYKATAVYVPSCTSDLFAGGGAGGAPGFDGRAVVDAVLARFLAPHPDIAPPARLVDADQVVFVGPPGVLARLGAFVSTLREAAAAADPPGNPVLAVTGLLDGGMLPGGVQPFNASAADCTTDANCPPATALAAAARLWWGPNATASSWMPWCAAAGDPATAHECLLAETLVPHLLQPQSVGSGQRRPDAPPPQPPPRVLVQQQQYDAALLRAFGAWPAGGVNGTAAAAWAEAALAPALLALLPPSASPAGASFSAACEGPPALAASSAFYHTLVRFADAYGHVQAHPLLNAVGAFLDDPPAAYGQYRDNCTAVGCNPSGCAV